jgi:hypothetical protein
MPHWLPHNPGPDRIHRVRRSNNRSTSTSGESGSPREAVMNLSSHYPSFYFFIRFTFRVHRDLFFYADFAVFGFLFSNQCDPTYLSSHFQIKMNREELLALAQQKDDIEKELIDLANELKLQDNVGMTGELVDREGFPR